MNTVPIFMALPFKKCFTRDQGLLPPFDKSERKLGSIIQLIVRLGGGWRWLADHSTRHSAI
jgi:hypothetical protein